jgi:hypothetical protein
MGKGKVGIEGLSVSGKQFEHEFGCVEKVVPYP